MNSDLHASAQAAIHDDPERREWDEQIRLHVDGCTPCKQTLDALIALRNRLHSQFHRSAPESLVQNLRAEIRGSEKVTPISAHPASTSARLPRSTILVPLSLAAGLILGILIAPQLGLFGSFPMPGAIHDGEVVRTSVDFIGDVTHDRYLLDGTGRTLEVLTRDPELAGEWLSEGLGFTVALGPTSEDWGLTGVRMWHTVSRLSALAEYEHDGSRVTVFAVTRKGLMFDSNTATIANGMEFWTGDGWGFRGITWVEGDLAWAVVSDLEQDALLEWATQYRKP